MIRGMQATAKYPKSGQRHQIMAGVGHIGLFNLNYEIHSVTACSPVVHHFGTFKSLSPLPKFQLDKKKMQFPYRNYNEQVENSDGFFFFLYKMKHFFYKKIQRNTTNKIKHSHLYR